MGQTFVNLPVPAGNGSGVAVDTSSMGPLKTMVLSGGANCVVLIEMANDPAGSNWAPVWVFAQSGTKSLDVSARWMRATVQQYKSGTPQVDVGGTDEGSSFVQLVAPAGNGVGAAVDVSALGLFRTVHVGGPFTGQINIEVSEDGVNNWATAFSFQHGDQQSAMLAARWMRVSRNGVSSISPGAPLIYVGLTTFPSGVGGVAIAAGTQTAATGTIDFANSNGISFGMSDSSLVTASMDAFRSMIAGTATATGPTLSFADSNNVSFGITGETVTASLGAVQSVVGGTSTAVGPTISFQNGGNVTFGISGNTITASVQTAGGTASGVGLGAGTQTATSGVVTFVDSNGLSFGLSASSLTATFAGIKTVIASGSTLTNGQLSFVASNGVSFGLSGSTLTASVTQPTVNSLAGFTATGGETAFTVTMAAQANTAYSVFGQCNGVSFIVGLDCPAGSANRSLSAFKVIPTASLQSGDQFAFYVFER